MAGEWIPLKVSDGSNMRGYLARPETQNGYGLLIIQEAFGVNAHIRDVTERFAAEGYLAIAPELYHRTGEGVEIAYTDMQGASPHREALTDDALIADLQAAYDWLAGEVGEKVASVGFCMGGSASFLANTLFPLTCAVSFYGGKIADAYLERALQLHGPMLMLWGGLDKHISQEQKRKIVDKLDYLMRPYVNIDFSNADHGFFCDARAAYNPKAAAVAWPLVLAFLKTHFTYLT
ncbi:MAG TPA: dienelactone hydrolase family protein [Candidatus Paceibacterota bacterium]